MKELQWLIKWIEDYKRDYFGVHPHANLIKSIIECRILELKDKTL